MLDAGADYGAGQSLYQAGVVLLDMRMPVHWMGGAFMMRCAEGGSTTAVVFLTGHGDVPMAVERNETRRRNVFSAKPVSVKPLQAALERALTVSSAAVARREIILCYQQLTPKERELASTVAKGFMNRDEIAEAMNIAVRTVEVHRARSWKKCRPVARRN